jgi:hypothetical protein
MLSEMEAMALLCRGHALEWTGKGWRMAFEREQAAIIHIPEQLVADVAWLVEAPTTAIEHVVCTGSRAAVLLREAGANRAWC